MKNAVMDVQIAENSMPWDFPRLLVAKSGRHPKFSSVFYFKMFIFPARARSAWARRACALRALGLLLADGTPTGGRGEDFLSRQPDFFTETAVTPERKVEKSFPRWEINRHVEG